MTTNPNPSRLFVSGGEWLYQLEVRGVGDGTVLFWRTRLLDPHTRFPVAEVSTFTDLHEHNIAIAIEDSWLQHVMAAGENGATLPPIEMSFTEQEF